MKLQTYYLTSLFLILNVINAQNWTKTDQQIQYPKVDSYSIEDLDNNKKELATINWSKGYLEFSGTAYVNEQMAGSWGDAMIQAQENAKHIAWSDLADFVLDVMVMSNSQYKFKGLAKSNFEKTVGGLIKEKAYSTFHDKGMTEIVVPGKGKEPWAYGRYDLNMQMYSDKPAESIINPILANDRQGYIDDGFKVFQPVTPSAPGNTKISPNTSKYTGLIIDARGLNVQPSMAPGIFVEGVNKQQLYGALTVMSAPVQQNGVVSYYTNLDEAKTLSKLMQNGIINPLVIKATNITGNNNQSVFVSKNDASRIINENNNSNFLDECKVAFVVD